MGDELRLNSEPPHPALSAMLSVLVAVSVQVLVRLRVVVTKGLKARSGGTVRAGFEGGQMPPRSVCLSTVSHRASVAR